MLITCQECGLQMSDTALSCPHCGYNANNTKTTRQRRNKKKKTVTIAKWIRSDIRD